MLGRGCEQNGGQVRALETASQSLPMKQSPTSLVSPSPCVNIKGSLCFSHTLEVILVWFAIRLKLLILVAY